MRILEFVLAGILTVLFIAALVAVSVILLNYFE